MSRVNTTLFSLISFFSLLFYLLPFSEVPPPPPPLSPSLIFSFSNLKTFLWCSKPNYWVNEGYEYTFSERLMLHLQSKAMENKGLVSRIYLVLSRIQSRTQKKNSSENMLPLYHGFMILTPEDFVRADTKSEMRPTRKKERLLWNCCRRQVLFQPDTTWAPLSEMNK